MSKSGKLSLSSFNRVFHLLIAAIFLIALLPVPALAAEDTTPPADVTDQGVGIPEKDLPRVFERMFHSQPRQIPGVGGVGLGLSICKGIVEAHGGRIWIESEEGKGTKCFFTLPLYTQPGDRHGKKT